MLRLRLIAIALLLLSYAAPSFAQQLSPEELVALGKYKMTRIDSVMMARGFTDKKTNTMPGSTMTAYAYHQQTDSGVVMRSLTLGYRSNLHVLDLEYGLWTKKDADHFIQELLQDGFKKTVRTMQGIMPGESMKMISYQKGIVSISYDERQPDPDTKLYMFSISVEHYRS